MTSESDGLSWEREDTHFPDRLSRWGAELFVTRQSRAIRDICADHGFLFDSVRFAEIGGWVYVTVVPLGGKAHKPPPGWLVPLLIRIVPELRRRIAILRLQEREGYWEQVVDRWLDGEEDELLAEASSYFEADLGQLDDGALAALIERGWEYADRAVAKHFHLHGAGVNEIMRLAMELNRDHGFTTADLSGFLTGLSDTTTGPAAAQDGILDLVRAEGAEAALRSARSVKEVGAIAPQIDAALVSYLDTWGRRAIRYEMAFPTIAEQPAWILDALRSQLDRPSPARRAGTHAATRADVERRVLAALGDTEETARRIERARRAFPIREGNETATVGLPAAVLRRLGREAGRRLAGSGALDDPDHVFDVEPDEVVASLRHRPRADLARSAAESHASRTSPDRPMPPATHGPEAPPPDVSAFPDDVREPLEAVLWFASKASNLRTDIPDADAVATADRAAPANGGTVLVSGQGVAPGTYEGPARVVLDESDFGLIQSGDVLVCPITSPVWSMLFPSIGALVCDNGGPLSHPAIIAREFGIPAVVDTSDATSRLESGQLVRVDGSNGSIEAVE